MHEDKTIPFTNPAYRDELSELARARSESFARPWKRSWGSFSQNTRLRVTLRAVTRWCVTAICSHGRC